MLEQPWINDPILRTIIAHLTSIVLSIPSSLSSPASSYFGFLSCATCQSNTAIGTAKSAPGSSLVLGSVHPRRCGTGPTCPFGQGRTPGLVEEGFPSPDGLTLPLLEAISLFPRDSTKSSAIKATQGACGEPHLFPVPNLASCSGLHPNPARVSRPELISESTV